MALTIISTNQGLLSAGYNPLRYYVDSTNKNEKAFRYIVEVFHASTAIKIFEKKYAPRPVDGYAEVDISRDVQNYLSAHIPFGNSDFNNASEHVLKYDIKFGEEYIVAWNFSDYVFNSGLTAFIQTPYVISPPVVIGDQIRVELDNVYNDFRDVLNGLFTVTLIIYSLSGDIAVRTNLPWIGSGGATPGKIYCADNRKSRFLNLIVLGGKSTANIAIKLTEMNTFTGGDFSLSSQTLGNFMTTAPKKFTQNPSQDNWLAFWNNYNILTLRVTFENDLGDIAYRTINTTTAHGVVQIASGLGNMGVLTLLSGTLPIVKSNASNVKVYLTKTNGVGVSALRTFIIDKRCKISDYEIVFMDRFGTFSSFAMQLRAYEKGTVNRLSYNKQFGNVVAGLVVFNTFESGTTTYHVDDTKELSLNTNYMTDEESVYFDELLTSGYTYIKVVDDYFACQVVETGYETQRAVNKPLIKKSVTVRYAVQNPVNV